MIQCNKMLKRKSTNAFILLLTILYTFLISVQTQDFPEYCDEFYNSSCFALIRFGVNWSDANLNCELREGHLTSIHSESENNMIAGLLNNSNMDGDAWIGLNYTEHKQKGNWVDGTQVTYTKMLTQQPSSGASACIVIFQGGDWGSYECTDYRFYICRQQGTLFGILEEDMKYKPIEDQIVNITGQTTLFCRTDTYPSATTIVWEYKVVEDTSWSVIQGIWNSSTGISTLDTGNRYGMYRCHVTNGGVEKIYTANVAGFIATTTEEFIATTTPTVTEATPQINSTITLMDTTIISTTTSNTQANPPESSQHIIIALVSIFGIIIFGLISSTSIILITLAVWYRNRKKGRYEHIDKSLYTKGQEMVATEDDKKSYENVGKSPEREAVRDYEIFEPADSDDIQISDQKYYSTGYIKMATIADENSIDCKVFKTVEERMKPIPLTEYNAYVEELLESEDTLVEEFQSFGGTTLRYPCETAQLECNWSKNKSNISPYDKSRVMLAPINNDPTTTYINASHIPGLYLKINFIATQEPIKGTVEDFWRMIFENKVENIIVLNKTTQNYFPDKVGSEIQFGSFTVTQISSETFLCYTLSCLRISAGKHMYNVKHYAFTTWIGDSMPKESNELIHSFRIVATKIIPTNSPVVVHCSNGIGSTGTFISLVNLFYAIEQMKPISIYKLVHHMREHRPQMVQTIGQYKYIHLAVLEMLSHHTTILAKDFLTSYCNLIKKDHGSNESRLSKQFKELNFRKEFNITRGSTSKKTSTKIARLEVNVEKNPSMDALPFDANRVILLSSTGGSNYINASYMNDFEFIATVQPFTSSLTDFLQMIFQTEASLIVTLATEEEVQKFHLKNYWGELNSTKIVPPFSVKTGDIEMHTPNLIQTLTITDDRDKNAHSFKHIIVEGWKENEEVLEPSSILMLIDFIKKHRESHPIGSVIIHCNDGIGRTGVVLTVYKAIQDLKERDSVDIFQIIKEFRNERMNIVPTFTHFSSCFELVNEHCSGSHY